MALADLVPAKPAKLSLVAVSVALILFCALDNPTAYAQQGGNATGGAATGGPSVSGDASIVCNGTTCVYNIPGGDATGGQATGGAATGNGGNLGTPPAPSKLIDRYSFTRTLGSEGSTDGQFDGPSGIAVDSSGNVYVADYVNDRVQVFSPNPEYPT